MALKRTAVILLVLLSATGLILGGCGGGTTPAATTAPAVSTTEAQETTATITQATTTTAAPTTTTAPPVTTAAVTLIAPTPEPSTSAAATATPTPSPEQVIFTLTSTAFTEGQPIPAIHGYYNGNKSPELDWTGAPEGTVSFVLIMEDPDGGNWSHWVVFNLGADIEGLGENQPALATLGDNVKQGTNDFGGIGYGGPSPPAGIHHYYFHLYALDAMLNLNGGATRAQVDNAKQGHILGEAVLMGTVRA
jgi:Raf kinase inhibitor-like YbhB/YbcL family protein